MIWVNGLLRPLPGSEPLKPDKQTFDQALLDHVRSGRVAMDEALAAATSPHDFKLLVASDGRRSTSVEQVLSG